MVATRSGQRAEGEGGRVWCRNDALARACVQMQRRRLVRAAPLL